MIRFSGLLYVFITAAFFTGCKEKYNPVLRAEQKNYLVVEGILNASGNTSVRLSRTSDLNETSGIKSESGANLIVAGSDGLETPLFETTAGIYAGNLQLSTANTYSLHIRTTDGKDYASAIESVQQTPSIDTLTWALNDRGLQIYLSTQDVSQVSKYYKWDYVETWEVHSAFDAFYEYIDPQVVPRSFEDRRLMYTCWSSFASVNILIGSSARLNEAVVNKAPLLQILNGDERLSVRYSMLVRQYAINENAYNFYQQLKSNTESLGSIFDPLPTDISGNINCITDPSEKVIGYISVSNPQEKRIFINKQDVPAWQYRHSCETKEVANDPDSFRINFPPYIPYDAISFGPSIIAYKSSSIDFVDCRLRGSSTRPDFW